jgi:hypothetical protein
VHCIGIGGEEEVPIPIINPDGREAFLRDDAGRVVRTKFEEGTLRQIAAQTGGRYVRSSTGGELAAAIEEIVKGERRVLGWRKTTEYRDLYAMALSAAAVSAALLWLLL